MKKFIRSNADVGTYKGVTYGMEDNPPMRYYFRDKNGKLIYGEDEEEIKIKIDNSFPDKVEAGTNPFHKIDAIKFTSSLFSALKQLLPKNCYPKIRSEWPNEILLDSVPSRRKVVDAVIKALDELGYDVYIASDADFDIAAVKGNAFATIIVDVDPKRYDYNYAGFISINCNHGNVLLEDWYNPDEEDILI